MDYGALTKKLVADAINNKIPGLNKQVVYKAFQSEGRYDPATSSRSIVYTDIPVTVVTVRPTYNEVTQMDITAASVKLLIPGTAIPEPTPNSDKVVIDGQEWWVKKYVGVPGGSLWSVFVDRT